MAMKDPVNAQRAERDWRAEEPPSERMPERLGDRTQAILILARDYAKLAQIAVANKVTVQDAMTFAIESCLTHALETLGKGRKPR